MCLTMVTKKSGEEKGPKHTILIKHKTRTIENTKKIKTKHKSLQSVERKVRREKATNSRLPETGACG